MEIILSNECSAFNLSHLKDEREGDKACARVVSAWIIQPERRCENRLALESTVHATSHYTELQTGRFACCHGSVMSPSLSELHPPPPQSVILYILSPTILQFHCRCILIGNYCSYWHTHQLDRNSRKSTETVMDKMNTINYKIVSAFNTFNKVQLSRHSFNNVVIVPWAVCFSWFRAGLQLMTFMRTRL